MSYTSNTSTNFPQGFTQGLSVRGMPLLQSNPGQVYFVNNSPVLLPQQRAGSDGNRGTFLDPFATLNNAINVATQGRGDIIFVGAGHKETLTTATQLQLDTAGVCIIGLGSGTSRPTFTLQGSAATTVLLTGTNISIQNCVFEGNFLSITAAITAQSATSAGTVAPNPNAVGIGLLTASSVAGTIYPGAAVTGPNIPVGSGLIILNQVSGVVGGAGVYTVNQAITATANSLAYNPTDFAIDNCEFRDRSGVLGFLNTLLGSTTANCLDGLSYTRNTLYSLSTVAATTAMSLQSSLDRVTIADNIGVSPVTAVTQGPCLMAAGANSITNFTLARNRFTRPNTSAAIALAIGTSGSSWTGHCYDNYFWGLASATGIWINPGTGLAFTNNYSPITGAADKSALINPVAV